MTEQKTETEKTETETAAVDPVEARIEELVSKKIEDAISKAVNGAVTAKLNSFVPKMFEEHLKKSETKKQKVEKVSAEENELEQVKKTVDQLTKQIELERQEKRSLKVKSELGDLLKGKVVDRFTGLALRELMGSVQYDEDGEAYVAVDGKAYALNDGVSKWLSLPDNKEMLAAPKKQETAKVQSISQMLTSQPQSNQQTKKLDPGSEEYLEQTAKLSGGALARLLAGEKL